MSDELRKTGAASSAAKPKKRVAYTDKEYIYMEISDEEMERMLRKPGAKRVSGEAKKTPAPKPVVKKPEYAKETKPVEKRRSAEIIREEKPKVMEAKNHKRVIREEKKKLPLFWICLGAWAVILIILGIVFLNYTDKCLAQYEAAQPEHMMETVLADMQTKIADGSIVQELSLPSTSGAFESSDICGQMFLAQAQGKSSYTFTKDAASYNTEAPIYDILADDNMIAKVTLASSNEKTIFGILTIMDWNVERIEPVINVETKSYEITVPSIFSVAVNDVPLGEEYITANTENPDYKNVSEYVSMPTDVTYVVSGLINEPVITITDEKGNTSQATITDGEVTAALSGDSMSEERKEMVFKYAKTWQNFLNADLPGNSYGLATVREILIKDSIYWEQATAYAGSVDITFTSAHTTDGYTEPIIDEYVEYSDTCFSCHINYVKNMTLTRNGDKSKDTVDSIIYFVYYDDSDDGVENPRWLIADMIPKTH